MVRIPRRIPGVLDEVWSTEMLQHICFRFSLDLKVAGFLTKSEGRVVIRPLGRKKYRDRENNQRGDGEIKLG